MQFLEVGDICSVPFNIACGRCRNCREGQTGVCLNVNPARAGLGLRLRRHGRLGGRAGRVRAWCPFADFNLLKFPDRDQALEKILDLTMLSDIFPTGYHGAYTAGVTTGSTVYVAGAGPVGLAAAYSAQLLGAAVVIVGDLNADRLAQARSFGCETVDISQDATLEDQIAEILGTNEVDCAVDAVGFEASGHGSGAGEAPAAVLNSIMALTRAGGGSASPACTSPATRAPPTPTPRRARSRCGSGSAGPRATRFATGQCPVLKYNRGLMMSILHDKAHIADAVNATVIRLDDAPRGYADFDKGAAKKYVLDPHGLIPAA